MHTRREHVGEAALDGKLYVLGGRAPRSLAVDTAERFDPQHRQLGNAAADAGPQRWPGRGLARRRGGRGLRRRRRSRNGHRRRPGIRPGERRVDAAARAAHRPARPRGGRRRRRRSGSSAARHCAYFNATDKVEHADGWTTWAAPSNVAQPPRRRRRSAPTAAESSRRLPDRESLSAKRRSSSR